MKFEKLSFVGTDASGEYPKVLPWQPDRTGDYTKDCKIGRDYFHDLRDLMVATDNPTFLSRVLRAQVEGGTWDGVEIGFAQAMSEMLMRVA